MIRIYPTIVALMAGMSLALAPVAHADDPVVYEVRSSTIPVADVVEWSDTAGNHTLQNVPLPWRTSVMVGNARSDEASLSAHWHPGSFGYPNPGRYMWLTIRIYTKGSLLCEITLDLGESACSGRGHYADTETPR